MSEENKDLRRKVKELKERNETLGLTIQRSRHSVKRLKLEYAVLLERLEARVELDPSLRFENPLPTLASFKKNLMAGPLKRSKTRRQRAKERDPNMPKRPTNAYLIYCEMNKEKIRQNGSLDVTRDLTEGWKNLDEEGKLPYYKLYNEDRERYQQEMEKYNKTMELLNSRNMGDNSDDNDEEEEEEEEGEGEGEEIDDADDGDNNNNNKKKKNYNDDVNSNDSENDNIGYSKQEEDEEEREGAEVESQPLVDPEDGDYDNRIEDGGTAPGNFGEENIEGEEEQERMEEEGSEAGDTAELHDQRQEQEDGASKDREGSIHQMEPERDGLLTE